MCLCMFISTESGRLNYELIASHGTEYMGTVYLSMSDRKLETFALYGRASPPLFHDFFFDAFLNLWYECDS